MTDTRGGGADSDESWAQFHMVRREGVTGGVGVPASRIAGSRAIAAADLQRVVSGWCVASKVGEVE